MRACVLTFAAFSLVAPALAQMALAQTQPQPPREIGNRANGLSYQPTPGQVRPAERHAGVQPPQTREQTENRDLERIDRNALRSEGMSTKSVPDMAHHNQ